MCCATGARHLRVVFVRNPFTRISSYYLKAFQRRMRFEVFIANAIRHPASCIKKNNCSAVHSFRMHHRKHVVPISEVMQDLQPPTGGQAEVYVVHLELLKNGLKDLELRLCRKFSFCEPLPPFPSRNRRPLKVKMGLWTNALRHQILSWQHGDFKAFGYGDDPQNLLPTRPLAEICGPFRLGII